MQSLVTLKSILSRGKGGKRTFLTILFTAFFLISFHVVPIQSFANNTISGTVSLPAGHVAPSGGVTVEVTPLTVNDWGSIYYATIAEGESSTSYSLIVPTIADARWYISYRYAGNEPYVSGGYYNATATTWNYNQLTLLAGATDHANINLTLLSGNTISGTVSLPAGQVAPSGGLNFSISATISAFEFDSLSYSCGYSVTIPEGESSINYNIIVPTVTGEKWRIQYFITQQNELYSSVGYYNDTATTGNYIQATLLAGATDHAAINMTFFTHKISGTVTLPAGYFAPSGGMLIYVSAQRLNPSPSPFSSASRFWSSLFIAEGESSANYTITMGSTYDGEWRVNYYRSEPYVEVGFYNSTATTGDYIQATLMAGMSDHNGINMKLLTTDGLTNKILTKKFPWPMFLPVITNKVQ
ncbi:MAG: hypothetical protein Q7U64_07820 [Desulfocapsaceae bacterium]|nr:hypothetical protein [Desulfocapsaceae bacterium]